MDFEAIKMWLTQWVHRQARNCRVQGVFGLMLGPVALVIVLTGIYWLLRLFTQDSSGHLGDPTKCLWIALAIVPCQFIGNRLVPRRDLMEERMCEGPEDSLAGDYLARREVVFLFSLWILFTGPRLFDWAFGSFREMRRIKQMDTHGCAAVLWILIRQGRKVSFDDIQRELDWLNLEFALDELTQIPGVVILKNPPPGLSLTQDLRDTIRSRKPD